MFLAFLSPIITGLLFLKKYVELKIENVFIRCYFSFCQEIIQDKEERSKAEVYSACLPCKRDEDVQETLQSVMLAQEN